MKKSSWIFLYLIAALSVALSSYRYYTIDTRSSVTSTIEKPDAKIWRHYMQNVEINRSVAYVWGIRPLPKPKPAKKIKRKKEKPIKKRQPKIGFKNNNLCIDKKCFRLLGLFMKKSEPYATFYSAFFRKKIEAMKKGQCLVKTYCIEKIELYSVTVVDRKTGKYWRFKLFDVNQSKYKPAKDLNVSYQ